MLSGKLPTGTVGNRRDGGGSAAERGRERTAGRTATGGTTGKDATRTERTSRGELGESTEAARRRGDCAALRRRLERELASERARRRAVIARYERLLTEQREGRNAEWRNADGGAAREVAATVRRALTRLRLRLPSPPGRSRSRRG